MAGCAAGRGASAAAAGQVWHQRECDHPAGRGSAHPDGSGQNGIRAGLLHNLIIILIISTHGPN